MDEDLAGGIVVLAGFVVVGLALLYGVRRSLRSGRTWLDARSFNRHDRPTGFRVVVALYAVTGLAMVVGGAVGLWLVLT
ncbi:hypothetical protein [Roseicyclus persicicus]|uniref:Uncharacterized protein n=1 Tax=Roseicyclus persicicus TaxID=2650661 RepID=A0A7X6GYZ4_9RHOB|nr:hypothetical protein [Roseibacterium persicicum]NKX44943.1 hypothetical protein [Roseibacterium persicicum]